MQVATARDASSLRGSALLIGLTGVMLSLSHAPRPLGTILNSPAPQRILGRAPLPRSITVVRLTASDMRPAHAEWTVKRGRPTCDVTGSAADSGVHWRLQVPEACSIEGASSSTVAIRIGHRLLFLDAATGHAVSLARAAADFEFATTPDHSRFAVFFRIGQRELARAYGPRRARDESIPVARAFVIWPDGTLISTLPFDAAEGEELSRSQLSRGGWLVVVRETVGLAANYGTLIFWDAQRGRRLWEASTVSGDLDPAIHFCGEHAVAFQRPPPGDPNGAPASTVIARFGAHGHVAVYVRRLGHDCSS